MHDFLARDDRYLAIERSMPNVAKALQEKLRVSLKERHLHLQVRRVTPAAPAID